MAEPVPEAGTPRADYPEEAYSVGKLSDAAKEAGVWLLAGTYNLTGSGGRCSHTGSIPETNGSKMRNCCTIYDDEGEL